MTDGLIAAHDLVVAMDYGQFLLRGGAARYCPDDGALLHEAQESGEGVAADGTVVLVRSPHQNNFSTALRVEVWDRAQTDDLDDWDEAFEAVLTVDEQATLWFDSPTMAGSGCAVPPGRYRVLITGRGIVADGWPGSTTPGDSWRVRLWPAGGDSRQPRRLRSWNTSWTPQAVALATAVDHQEWTARLRAELLGLPPGDQCCRRAEAAALLRLTRGGPVGADCISRLGILMGDRAADPDLPAELGLVNAAGGPTLGLPPTVMTAQGCCCAAVWRGALLVGGTLVATGTRLRATVVYPHPSTAMGLVGTARRLGVGDVAMREATSQVLVNDAPALLEILGTSRTVAAWRSVET